MLDRFGSPIATLNVPMMRVKRDPTRLTMSVTFEASIDLADFHTHQSDEELRRYVSAFLMQHIERWYWGARDGK